MTDADPGPLIPSLEELNGRAMDNATEAAARYAIQAARAAPWSGYAEYATQRAGAMKEYVAELRDRPLTDRFRPLVWDTPVDYRSLPPVELKPTSAEEYERTAQGLRDLAALYPAGSENAVWHLEQAQWQDQWAADARVAEDEGRAR